MDAALGAAGCHSCPVLVVGLPVCCSRTHGLWLIQLLLRSHSAIWAASTCQPTFETACAGAVQLLPGVCAGAAIHRAVPADLAKACRIVACWGCVWLLQTHMRKPCLCWS